MHAATAPSPVAQQPWQLAFDRQQTREAISMRARGVCPSCGERAAEGHFSDCPEHPKHALAATFAEAMQGDMAATAYFAFGCGWLAKSMATTADVLADALGDNEALLRRAMVILANAAAGRGTQRDAQALIAEAGAQWAERHAS